MTAPSPRPYSIWDGPRCLHTGSVAAPSDADGLRAVLAQEPPVPLDPARHYRIRVGGAVASAAGDELARTGESSSMPDDAPALEARAERERVEAGARKLFGQQLADRLAEAAAARDTEGAERVGTAGLERIEYDPVARQSRLFASPCPAGGRHLFAPGTVTGLRDPAGGRTQVTVVGHCRMCAKTAGANAMVADRSLRTAEALAIDLAAAELERRLADIDFVAWLPTDRIRQAIPGAAAIGGVRIATATGNGNGAHGVGGGNGNGAHVGGGGVGGSGGRSGAFVPVPAVPRGAPYPPSPPPPPGPAHPAPGTGPDGP